MAQSPLGLVEELYEELEPLVLFAKAKEASWQTFFHHSASVGSCAYRIGAVVRRAVDSSKSWMLHSSLERVEKEASPLYYEEFLFFSGVVHDYVKMCVKERAQAARELLSKLLEKMGVEPGRARALADLMLSVATATEKLSSTELDEAHLKLVVSIVHVADILMGAMGVDEAFSALSTDRAALLLEEVVGVKFGFVKVAVPSLLQAVVSEKVVKALEESGWVQVAVYGDGSIFAGTPSAQRVSLERLAEIAAEEVRKEVCSDAAIKREINAIVEGMERRALGKLLKKLLDTGGRGELPVDVKELKRKRGSVSDIMPHYLNFYHNLVVRYLEGSSADYLLKTFGEVEKHLDVRTFATGYKGKGSVYFEEVAKQRGITKEALLRVLTGLGKVKLLTALSFIVAFYSKDDKVIEEIVEKAFGKRLPRGLPPMLLRLLAVAEVFRNRDRSDLARRVVEALPLPSEPPVGDYAREYVKTRILSNIIESGARELRTPETKHLTYCRVCGMPLYHDHWRFIEYTRVIAEGKGAGGSEIWLSDDPPLADLEDIAESYRHICPLCFYEALKVKDKFGPPFLVVALHPASSPDLLEFAKKRVRILGNVVRAARGAELGVQIGNVAEACRLVAVGERGGNGRTLRLKPEGETYGRVMELLGSHSKEEELLIHDALGARLLIPLSAGGEQDLSLKRKLCSIVLAVAPLALSLVGGGQVALALNLGDSFNVGAGQLPASLPHQPSMLTDVARTFNDIVFRARSEGRDPTPEEYRVYGLVYPALLATLYGFALRVFGWYEGWKEGGRGRHVTVEDYALETMTDMESVPHVPLAISCPPPERLKPRPEERRKGKPGPKERGEGTPLPYSSVLSYLSREVESMISEAKELVEGEKQPSLNRLLYTYAASLKELRKDLSRHKVQNPLRRSINVFLDFKRAIGTEDAKSLAIDEFLKQVRGVTGVNLEDAKKVITEKIGDKEEKKEVPYSAIFFRTISGLLDIVNRASETLPPSKLRVFVERLLDSAYEKYRSTAFEKGG